MLLRMGRVAAHKTIMCAGLSVLALSVGVQGAMAQSVDIGTVKGTVAKKKKKLVSVQPAAPVVVAAPAAAATTEPAIASDAAIGTAAPTGSAPALAPSQASLTASEPGSIVSGATIRNIAPPSSDFNDTAKYTPGFTSSNPNGSLGDSKSGWRGFKDGEFNISYDGVAFGDANDPSHHSAAYFPGPFIGYTVIDRGPGGASQFGYAPFGGSMALHSLDFTDKAGGSIGGSVGTWGTYTGNATIQSGLVGGNTHALLQYSYNKTDGALDYGHVDTNGLLFKLDHNFGDVKATVFGTTTYENYNNTNPITYDQLVKYGNTFGQVNGDPKSQDYVGYNNSQKRTDMEYIKLEGQHSGWQWDNKAYTYAYDYPTLQNNGADQSIIGPSLLGNSSQSNPSAGSINSVTIKNPPTGCTTNAACSTIINFSGVAAGDVTGFLKSNNYRAYGDQLNLHRDMDAGPLSGQLRTGLWLEHVDNHRYQQYIDYTTGVIYGTGAIQATVAPAPPVNKATSSQTTIDLAAAPYKLNLDSHIDNVQTYAEYEWKPFKGLSVTPGLKWESFSRIHVASVNNTTQQPANFAKTYTALLPSLAIHYNVNQELSVYAQTSNGFLAPPVAAYYVTDFNSNTIAPEQSTNYQIGTVYKSKNLTVAADAYFITATNLSRSLTVAGLTHFENAGTAQYKGIEAEGTYAFGNGLAVTASGSLADAHFIAGPNEGLTVQNAPRYIASGGLVYDNGSFFGSVLHKITGDQYGTKGEVYASGTVNPEINHLAAYNATDLVAGFRTDALKTIGINGKTEFKFGVNNVFDNRSLTDIGGTPAALTQGSTDGLTYTSQAGRNIYTGVKVNF